MKKKNFLKDCLRAITKTEEAIKNGDVTANKVVTRNSSRTQEEIKKEKVKSRRH